MAITQLFTPTLASCYFHLIHLPFISHRNCFSLPGFSHEVFLNHGLHKINGFLWLTSKILFFGGYQVATENTLHRGIFSRRAAEITEAATLTLAAVPDGTYKR